MTDDARERIYDWDDPHRRLPAEADPALKAEFEAAERLRADLRALGRPLSAAPPPLDWARLEPPARRIPWAPIAAAAALALLAGWWWAASDDAAAPPTPVAAPSPAPAGEGVSPLAPVATPAERALTTVRFSVEAPAARVVAVAGDFNDWAPEALPMTATDGRWQAQAALPPGRYAYMYVVDGRWITPPDAQRTQDDGFGARNGVLDLLGPPEV